MRGGKGGGRLTWGGTEMLYSCDLDPLRLIGYSLSNWLPFPVIFYNLCGWTVLDAALEGWLNLSAQNTVSLEAF